jgi:hypothetical protein
MLTPKDIQNLTEFQKTIFVTQENFDSGLEIIQKSFLRLENIINSFAKDNKDAGQEMPVINHRIKEVENWIDKAAVKLDIEFEY